MTDFDIAVIGTGLAGHLAALALARAGRRVALVGPAASTDADCRASALMDSSLTVLRRLGLWEAVKSRAAPLHQLRIVDATGRRLRAPSVTFRASEIGMDAFGCTIENTALRQALKIALDGETRLHCFAKAAREIRLLGAQVDIVLEDGVRLCADFVVGADGKASPTRQAADIGCKTWSCPQTAVVLNFGHCLPHDGVSTEYHTPAGPFTQAPLPGLRSSLVWVVEPQRAQTLLAMDAQALSLAVETQMESSLGTVAVEPGVQAWPLSGLVAFRYGKGRCALIGEAAHAFAPIGAQGLNLSLRDVIALETLLGGPRPINPRAGASFDRKRRADIWSRTASVDLLNRSLLPNVFPLQMCRVLGLHALGHIAPLRHLAMREGIAPGLGFGALAAAGGFGRR